MSSSVIKIKNNNFSFYRVFLSPNASIYWMKTHFNVFFFSSSSFCSLSKCCVRLVSCTLLRKENQFFFHIHLNHLLNQFQPFAKTIDSYLTKFCFFFLLEILAFLAMRNIQANSKCEVPSHRIFFFSLLFVFEPIELIPCSTNEQLCVLSFRQQIGSTEKKFEFFFSFSKKIRRKTHEIFILICLFFAHDFFYLHNLPNNP